MEIDLQENDVEYDLVLELVRPLLESRCSLLGVRRVVNANQRERWELLERQMARARNLDPAKEEDAQAVASLSRHLFHGTREQNIQLITRDGFDRSFAGLNGAIFF